MPSLTVETLNRLINVKLEFYRDEDLRDKFIDRLLTHHPDMAVSVFDAITGNSTMGIEMGGGIFYVDKVEYEKAATFAKSDKKVDAIKQMRAITGWGLKEAKDYVELNWPSTIRT